VRNQPFSLHIGKDTAAREIIKAPSEKADIGDYFAVFPPLPPQFLERLERWWGQAIKITRKLCLQG
jgi:hypothetical protein